MAGELLELQPDNLVVLLERARLAVKRGDAQALRRFGRADSAGSPRPGRRGPRKLTASSSKPRNPTRASAVTRVAFLRNVLVQTPAFRQGLAAVETPSGTVGEPIETFLRLAPPPPTPSPPDDGLAFAVEPLDEAGTSRWDTLLAVPMTGKGPPVLFVGRWPGRAAESTGRGQSCHSPAAPGRAPVPERCPRPGLELRLPDGPRLRRCRRSEGLRAEGRRHVRRRDRGHQARSGRPGEPMPSASGRPTSRWTATSTWCWAPGEGKVSVLRNNGDGTFGVVPALRRSDRPPRLRLGRPGRRRRPGRRAAGCPGRAPHLRERTRGPVPATARTGWARHARRPGGRRSE